ncbi:Protein MKS1 [Apostasia shenzhenica]|uniref:Protein MKS1 n=1 Tax=Apostasia shenzhenica TaxID=1088818 RepID=A0A2I0BGA2_9ASPA|nr:Protein MKS1 [Apostasia shenzhenica]
MGRSIAMDLYEQPAGQPLPRRELQLQGARPSPLKVRKDSHKISKKPPVSAVPPPPDPYAPPPQRRSPVIIYTVSPKVIHTKPSEFMSLVQRLTGVSSSSDAANGICDGAASGIEGGEKAERAGLSPRILSLLPPSGAPISSHLFSPAAAELISPLNFMNELSPGIQGSKAFMEGSFLSSPGNLLAMPAITSPGNYWDLFNQYKEL